MYVNRSIDNNSVRGEPKSGHGGVVANLKVKRGRAGTIYTWLEQQCIALRSELIGDLLVRYRVDCRLDLAQWHTRVEDHHVRAKVRLARRSQCRLHWQSQHHKCQYGC